MTESQPDAMIAVEVVYALPDHCRRIALDLPAGTTVGQALAASGLAELEPDLTLENMSLAIFSQLVSIATVLRSGDRLEILRPLLADPKDTRRARADMAAAKKPRG